jgi:hypothetical protein
MKAAEPRPRGKLPVLVLESRGYDRISIPRSSSNILLCDHQRRRGKPTFPLEREKRLDSAALIFSASSSPKNGFLIIL